MEKVKYDIFNPPGGLLIWIVIVLELLTFGIALLVMQNFELAEPQIFAESRQHLSSRLNAQYSNSIDQWSLCGFEPQ